MRIDFLQRLQRSFEDEEESYLLTVVSQQNKDNCNLRAGDRMLRAEDDFHFSRRLDADIMEELKLEMERLLEEGLEGLCRISPCGQDLEVYLRPLRTQPRLFIFGAGHVSSPLAEIAELAGFKVVVIDERTELMKEERFTENTDLQEESYEEFLGDFQAGSGDYIVIVTPGHLHDYQVLEEVIEDDWSYLGMIGSRRKVDLIFEEIMEKHDISAERLEEVDAPIGLDIGSETPEEIAVSIAASLVSARRCQS